FQYYVVHCNAFVSAHRKGVGLLEEFILSQTEGRVAVITLNRPDILNAWHGPMRAVLMEKLSAAENDPAVGAIVMTGVGDRAFGAGQDLNETKSFDPDKA